MAGHVGVRQLCSFPLQRVTEQADEKAIRLWAWRRISRL
jgi:hypothetical protein